MNHKEIEIAQWMLEKLDNVHYLYQEVVVYDIQRNFGQEYVYENENANLAISKKVLKEFRNLTKDTIVWEKGDKCWRKRMDYDTPGTRNAD
jgi:hypothetical protein